MGDDYEHNPREVDLVKEPETVWEVLVVVMEVHLVRRLAMEKEPCRGTYCHCQNGRLEVELL